jgi:hypothetical protein
MIGLSKELFVPVTPHDGSWDKTIPWRNEDAIHLTMRHMHSIPLRGLLMRGEFNAGYIMEVLVIKTIFHRAGLIFISVRLSFLLNGHFLFNH